MTGASNRSGHLHSIANRKSKIENQHHPSFRITVTPFTSLADPINPNGRKPLPTVPQVHWTVTVIAVPAARPDTLMLPPALFVIDVEYPELVNPDAVIAAVTAAVTSLLAAVGVIAARAPSRAAPC